MQKNEVLRSANYIELDFISVAPWIARTIYGVTKPSLHTILCKGIGQNPAMAVAVILQLEVN